MAQFSLSGHVKDEKGSVLPGASVKIENTGQGVATNSEGMILGFEGFNKTVNSMDLECN